MNIKSKFTFIITVLFTSLTTYNCSSKKENNATVKTKTECDCNLTDIEMENIFPVSAINDSVIICKKNKINGMKWSDFLTKNKFYTDYTIFNCQTKETIKGEFHRDNSFSYENKSLILYSKKEFLVFDTIKSRLDRIAIDVYKEKIFANNGEIKKSKEFILTPAKYNSKALQEVNNQFEKKKQNPSSNYIVDYLLGAALNGDNVSKDRLLNFNKIFPNHGEENNLDQALIILKDFESYKKNGGKIKFLDLSQYLKFNN